MPSILRLDILRELREKAELTQKEMAELCGLHGQLSNQTTSAWELGRIVPGPSRRAKFIGYLWDHLQLKQDPARFDQVWEILCDEWKWEPISDQEWAKFTHQARPARNNALEQKVAQLEVTISHLQEGFQDASATGLFPRDPTVLPLPPLPTPPLPPTLIGRTQELEMYNRLLANQGLAIITGMAGMGKTALAAALAQQAAPLEAIFWHSFHEGEGIEILIWRLAAFLAGHERPNVWQILSTLKNSGGQMPPPAILFDYLFQQSKGQDYVLCLDDFHYVEGDPHLPHFYERLAANIHPQHLRVIITSRQAPHFVQGQPYTSAPPLAGLSALDTYHFVANRGLALPDALLHNLYTYTGGNPQFLLLAVAALRQNPDPSAFVSQLAESDDVAAYLLTQIDRQLSEEERAVMGAVALGMGYPLSRDALEAMLDQSGLQRTLYRLCQRHMLLSQPEGAGAPRTYDQHGLVRDFYDHLLSSRQRRLMHLRAGRYYEEAAQDSPQSEADALLAARHYLRAQEYQAAAIVLTKDVWPPFNSGLAQALYQLLCDVPEAQLDFDLVLELHLARGQLALLLGEVQAGQSAYQQALTRIELATPTAAPTRLRRQEARACRGMAEALQDAAPAEAIAWVERGLQALAALPAPSEPATPTAGQSIVVEQEAVALYTRLGYVRLNMSDYAAALQAFQEALARLPAGPTQLRARILNNLGTLYTDQAGDAAQAAQGMACYGEALAISEAINDRWMMVGIWHNLGIEYEIMGKWAEAVAAYDKAQAWSEELGSRRHQVELALSLGILLTKQGDEAALARLQQAIALARHDSLNEHLLHALSSLADLYMRAPNVEAARPCLVEAQALAQQLSAQDVSAEIARLWALIYLEEGDVEAALTAAQDAVNVTQALKMPMEEGISLRVLGQVCQARGETALALAAFAQSEALLTDRDPYEAARTQAAWGRCIFATSPGEAIERLQQAKHNFQRLNAEQDLGTVSLLLTARPIATDIAVRPTNH